MKQFTCAGFNEIGRRAAYHAFIGFTTKRDETYGSNFTFTVIAAQRSRTLNETH